MATQLTVQSVLKKAIEKEIETQRLYQDLSRKMTDTAAKEAFGQLSQEEKGHEELLRKYQRGEIGTGRLRKTSLLDYKVAEYLDQPSVTPDMALKDIFLLAANREKASHDFYASLAAAHPAGEVKRLLEQLATQELKHKRKVEFLYTEVAFPQTDGGKAVRIGDVIKARGSSLSFEFFPPKDIVAEDRLFQTIATLKGYGPTFVSVTYGAGGGTLRNTRKVILRIKEDTSLVPMPHLTCVEQSHKDLDNILKDYKSHGIENVLALRGDPPKGSDKFIAHPDGYCYAIDLVRLVVLVGGYSIGVAVYPEGHTEAPDLETDMYYTKQKINAGADFAVTQMFFDNRFFYNFMERAEKAGITIPIIPGIMPITDIEKIKKFSQMTGATLPKSIVGPMEKAASPEEARKLGVEFATKQCENLSQNGVKYFHFYTLNQPQAVTEILTNLGFTKKAAPR